MNIYAVFADSNFQAVAVVIILIAVAGFAILSAINTKKRREALQKIALQMGYTFDRDGENFRLELNQHLHLLQLGDSQRAYNVLRGSCATGEIVLFEFMYSQKGSYNTQTGTQSDTKHYQTVAAFKFPQANIPYFHLASKHWWHKAAKVFGYQAISFDTHPQFGERYLLRGANETDIKQFFRPSLLEYLQSLPEKPVWNVEAGPPWLLVYQPSNRPKPEEIPAFRDAAATLAGDIMRNAEIRQAAHVGQQS
jgi:hypothetical protein